jgi:hypothetical protein
MCCREITEPPSATASRNASGLGDVLAVFQPPRQIEIVPANEAILDEPHARFRHLLFFFIRL